MSEPVTFRSIANAIKLARIAGTATKGWESQMKTIVDFVDAIMVHLGWPDELWTLSKKAQSGYSPGTAFIEIALDVKTHKDDTPVTIVLKFQAGENESIDMVSHDGKRFVASVPRLKQRPEQDSDALNNAGQTLLDAAMAAVSK